MVKYVIIGCSAGAVGAVEAIRELDPVGDIAVISEEPIPAYSRPMIGKYLSGEVNLENMIFPSKNFWEKQKVQLFLGKKAVKLDLTRKEIELEDAEKIGFDKLLIATGSKPIIPNIEGVTKKGVYTFTRIADAEHIRETVYAIKAQKAVVVGVGLIGITVTEALAKLGLKVTLIGRRDRVLNQVLDQKAAGILEEAMRKEGVCIVKGRTVQRILGRKDNDDMVGGVLLDDGSAIECDLVVFAVGVVPRTELVINTELKINNGVLTDRFTRTNIPDVYACGDVAETYDFVVGKQRVLALWPLARISGRVAGYNMAGLKLEYPGVASMTALNHFGVPIISVGLTTQSGDSEGYETLVFHDQKRRIYRKIMLKSGKIMGMTLVGDVERAGVIFHLMKNKVNVEDFKHKLIADNFSLASLPETLRKQLIWEVCNEFHYSPK
ncbi:NAD(P)/FAD-dependent oxidoreductase [Candidatus Bathyarchaeota archaeon]|nr:NAD(P)/FAD-dependent oxidoreductase [Candidatus Bathyarchaeota archaeon]